MMESDSESALQYLKLVGQLKNTLRTGWVYSHVNDFTRVESVADHSWRMAAAAFLFSGDKSYDVGKMIQMAVLHDIAESITGDIAPADNVGPAEKKKREADAIETIMKPLGLFSSIGSTKCLALIHEYEERVSNEAIAVKDLDMLEMIIQANEYEIETGINLSAFFDSTCGKFKTRQVISIVTALTTQRNLRKSQEKSTSSTQTYSEPVHKKNKASE